MDYSGKWDYGQVWSIVKMATVLLSSLHQEVEMLTPPFEWELALLLASINRMRLE